MSKQRPKTCTSRFLFLTLSAISLLSACAAEVGASNSDAFEEELEDLSSNLRLKNANTMFQDEDIEGDQDITVEEVQSVLDRNNSPLRNLRFGSRSAAQIVVEESIARQISPVFMISRIQTEQSLITSRQRVANVDAATGCGCHDARRCTPAYKGFEKQIRCTANLFRSYMDNIRAGRYAINGGVVRASDRQAFLIGRRTKTIDPLRAGGSGCFVTPSNAATAAVLTYTPYVGRNVTSLCTSTEPGGAGLQIRTLQMARRWFGIAPR